MSQEKANEILERNRQLIAKADAPSEADREAPPAGGDGSAGASGNVGGYNSFWIDAGDSVVLVDGKVRTSLITDPPNGRQPPMTPEGQASLSFLRDLFRANDGSAYWLEWDRPGPWDDPEGLLISDHCLASCKSAVPSLPSLYNNLQRIVQTEDRVMILNEMVHDARVVRLNSKHAPPELKFWLGDSIGWWEGDTLVVDTTNFKGYSGFASTSETLHVVERFTRKDAESLLYEFKVEDPSVWMASWSGDQLWPATQTPEERVFEYACHEGNYAMGNFLRGARLLEVEAPKRAPATSAPASSRRSVSCARPVPIQPEPVLGRRGESPDHVRSQPDSRGDRDEVGMRAQGVERRARPPGARSSSAARATAEIGFGHQQDRAA